MREHGAGGWAELAAYQDRVEGEVDSDVRERHAAGRQVGTGQQKAVADVEGGGGRHLWRLVLGEREPLRDLAWAAPGGARASNRRAGGQNVAHRAPQIGRSAYMGLLQRRGAEEGGGVAALLRDRAKHRVLGGTSRPVDTDIRLRGHWRWW